MLDEYRAWLASELALLGNASHHAYAFGQANMAKRAIEKLDEVLAKSTGVAFVEAPSKNVEADTAFYYKAFGWELQAFGPSYASTMSAVVDFGLQADYSETTAAVLVAIAVADLEECLATVTAAGAAITRPIFAFPGGRRFHFKDPSGNELAAFELDEPEVAP